MVFKAIANARKGQNHQRRATPCEWKIELFQALNRKPERLSSTKVKGRRQALCRMPPLQDLNSRIYPSHRALSDANANKAFSLNYDYKFFISHP
jgi:hypothetical protein